MRKILKELRFPFRLFLSVLYAGLAVQAVPYDYSATIECLAEPLKPQYGGGVLVNSEFNHNLKGWSRHGGAQVERRISKEGNAFVVTHSREKTYDSISQMIDLKRDMIYTFSAWVQISDGSSPITAVFKTGNGTCTHAAKVVAQSGCWSMMKGGLSPHVSGPAKLYFESKNTTVEIWVDSVSLQPFTQQEWTSHQEESTRRNRRRQVKIHAKDAQGNVIPNATFSLKLVKPSFPFGCAINKNILNNQAYQNWFLPRFSVTTFEDEMKWYSTEGSQGREDYSTADAMMAFAKQHGLQVRGHNVLWDDPRYQPGWVPSLSPDQLRAAATHRVQSVMSRYKGQVIGWDVVNENIHFNFLEGKLGADASTNFYQQAHQIDPSTRMFLNDYNTMEDSSDPQATPANYIRKLNEVKSLGLTGIGLEGHFHTPNIAYMRSAIDAMAATGVPIWLTEVDVSSNPNQAQFLEQVLNEGHSHPSVEGIVIWAAWKPQGCYAMCLTDNNFNNLATGNVVDKLLNTWKRQQMLGIADGNGMLEGELAHGDYEVTITHPLTNSSLTHSLKVERDNGQDKPLYVMFHV